MHVQSGVSVQISDEPPVEVDLLRLLTGVFCAGEPGARVSAGGGLVQHREGEQL